MADTPPPPTPRSMAEREEAIRIANQEIANWNVKLSSNVSATGCGGDPSNVILARALLSLHASEARMRKALEELIAWDDERVPYMPRMMVVEAARAALQGPA